MLNFIITMKDVMTNISLLDIIRAFGDNSFIYYNNDPKLIEAFVKMIENIKL